MRIINTLCAFSILLLTTQIRAQTGTYDAVKIRSNTSYTGVQIFGNGSATWDSNVGPGYLQLYGSRIYDNGDYLHFSDGARKIQIHSGDANSPVTIKLDGAGSSFFGGNLGVGISTPGVNFHVSPSTGRSQLWLDARGGGDGNNTDLFLGDNGSQKWSITHRPSDQNSDFVIWRHNSQWTRELTVSYSSGFVGIGTTSPDQKLTVNGNIHAKEVKVDLSVPGPDYVFDEDYQLTSLGDLKKYIDEHRHLPEVPSAKEMERDGINLMEMNVMLLKKVEELTLLLIKTDEKLNSANKRIERLEKKSNNK